jgi:hypothetical protein
MTRLIKPSDNDLVGSNGFSRFFAAGRRASNERYHNMRQGRTPMGIGLDPMGFEKPLSLYGLISPKQLLYRWKRELNPERSTIE